MFVLRVDYDNYSALCNEYKNAAVCTLLLSGGRILHVYTKLHSISPSPTCGFSKVHPIGILCGSCLEMQYNLKALGQYISGIRLLNLNTAITEQVNGNSTT